ncbi:MAG: TetR/AcrR family transcriptional regulator C-terminal domain-containing protein [Solirubrobacteraceae bacterium]
MPGGATKRIPVKRRPAGLSGVTDGPRRRGRPARLSRPAILDKALELIDSKGPEALTMRRLGAELGVEAMSLYRHVANKRALLDGIAERLMDEVGTRRGEYGGDWEASALSLGLAVRAVAQAHPGAFELVGARALNTFDALRPIESLLTDLRAGGFAPDRAVAAHRLLASYIRGFALVEMAGFTLSASSDPGRLTPATLPAEEFPTIRELAGELVSAPTDDEFRAGIATIIAGLRRELEAPPRLTARAHARARS